MTKRNKKFLCLAVDADERERFLSLLLEGSLIAGTVKIASPQLAMVGYRLLRHTLDVCRETGGDGELFLDLKLLDIPSQVERTARVHATSLPLFGITVHARGGRAMLEAAVAGAAKGNAKVIAVTRLTSDPETARTQDEVLDMVRAAVAAGCQGIVCSPRECLAVKAEFPGLLVVTPGIRPVWATVTGDDQQRAETPKTAIRAGSDLLVVGRPIIEGTSKELRLQAAARTLAEIDMAVAQREARRDSEFN